jgi:hypothetical protein
MVYPWFMDSIFSINMASKPSYFMLCNRYKDVIPPHEATRMTRVGHKDGVAIQRDYKFKMPMYFEF